MKIRAAFCVLIITCITLLLINFQLNKDLNKLNKEKEEYKHRYEVTQKLYDLMRDEVLRLENENQLLGSFIAEKQIQYK
tara:strand:- start:1118 stop:1354 length:237 start_codon:yes stop_codon:yes gene_type:complete